MTLSFSWAGISACEGGDAASPAFTLRNIPDGTTTLVFALSNPMGRDFGEGAVPYTGAIVDAGAIRTRGPCQTSTYTWRVEARDSLGATLGTAQRGEHFPD